MLSRREGEQVGVPISKPEASVGLTLRGRPRPAQTPVLRGRHPQGSKGRSSPAAIQGAGQHCPRPVLSHKQPLNQDEVAIQVGAQSRRPRSSHRNPLLPGSPSHWQAGPGSAGKALTAPPCMPRGWGEIQGPYLPARPHQTGPRGRTRLGSKTRWA